MGHARTSETVQKLGHWGVVSPVSGDDDVIGEPDGETGGDDGVEGIGQVICIYVPFTPSLIYRISIHLAILLYCILILRMISFLR